MPRGDVYTIDLDYSIGYALRSVLDLDRDWIWMLWGSALIPTGVVVRWVAPTNLRRRGTRPRPETVAYGQLAAVRILADPEDPTAEPVEMALWRVFGPDQGAPGGPPTPQERN